MLSKEEKSLILKAGRYTYDKMKKIGLPLNIDAYEKYLEQKEKEKNLKKKIGYRRYNKMKELKLSYKDFIQYEREQKFKKYETKRTKDKLRQRTVRYIERYCDLKMECQICKTEESVQIHHPNYKDWLKINLLCRNHHTDLHNFELIPPEIIDLEKISIIKPPKKEKTDYINSILEDMKNDVMQNGFTYADLAKKYNLASSTVSTYFKKQDNYFEIEQKLKNNARNKMSLTTRCNKQSPLLEYKLKHNCTTADISKITGIPISTLRAVECGKIKLSDKSCKTRIKLEECNIISNLN